jgi:hypothetical protein
VILLSARAGEEAKVEGLEAGANDYLSKPFSARGQGIKGWSFDMVIAPLPPIERRRPDDTGVRLGDPLCLPFGKLRTPDADMAPVEFFDCRRALSPFPSFAG